MDTKVEEKKELYEVLIIKRDQNHIVVMSVPSYDKCYEKWTELLKIWTEALKDKIPFVLKDPVVTAFDPGLIMEISIMPVMKVAESKYDNPYQKEMMKKGLSQTLRSNGNALNSDILDEGYR